MTAGALAPHGSYGGYQRHLRAGEVPCRECAGAQSARIAWWKFRTGRQLRPPACVRCGSVFYGHVCGGVRS